MTLNLMLTSRSSVYLSGDFRITFLYPGKGWRDDVQVQKLIPVFKYEWSALVAFTGVAKHSLVNDVGEWISVRLNGIDHGAPFHELQRTLLTADTWLSKVLDHRELAFSVVGYDGRRPTAMIISNFLDIDGHILTPTLPELRLSMIRPKTPEVRVAGDRGAVPREERDRLKKMLAENRKPREIHAALAEINALAARRSSTISPGCATGHLLPTGTAEVTPHGIPKGQAYMPGFVMRDLAASGCTGFKLKVDQGGRSLPPRWKGMTASKAKGPRREHRAIMGLHAFENVAEVLGGGAPRKNTVAFTRVAGPDEPERYSFNIQWEGGKSEGC